MTRLREAIHDAADEADGSLPSKLNGALADSKPPKARIASDGGLSLTLLAMAMYPDLTEVEYCPLLGKTGRRMGMNRECPHDVGRKEGKIKRDFQAIRPARPERR
jgi:hypothetical protein